MNNYRNIALPKPKRPLTCFEWCTTGKPLNIQFRLYVTARKIVKENTVAASRSANDLDAAFPGSDWRKRAWSGDLEALTHERFAAYCEAQQLRREGQPLIDRIAKHFRGIAQWNCPPAQPRKERMNYPKRKPVFRFDDSWQEFAEIETSDQARHHAFLARIMHIHHTYPDRDPSFEASRDRFDIIITFEGLTLDDLREIQNFMLELRYPHPFSPVTDLQNGPYELDRAQLDLMRRKFPDRATNWKRLQTAKPAEVRRALRKFHKCGF